jgi:hypothetical protein
LWERLQVQWFDGDATAGRHAVRGIIRRAAKSIDLLDPYFGRDDLLGFPLATSVHGLPVRILTSAEVCAKQDDSGAENGITLLANLERIRSRDPRIAIEVRVMEGRKSPIHDRFLIADGTVWVLGSSLNEFGDRGTLLLRLPTPPQGAGEGVAPISIARDVFQDWWKRGDERCPRLEEWVRRRREARGRETVLVRLTRSKTVFSEAWRRLREVWLA